MKKCFRKNYVAADAPLKAVTMQWTKAQMLEDPRVMKLIEDGVIGSSDTKATIVEAVDTAEVEAEDMKEETLI